LMDHPCFVSDASDPGALPSDVRHHVMVDSSSETSVDFDRYGSV
jgi:hypothetical protein